ncbi:twin-arginine translocation signal domain-containing protein [Saccharothrix lopnurensis]|uniref:Twin-arginine translocation signal domain-containing protein n=1 Tax=Saccharothrix lopnurensis TaxID=1670621 RepID=A0ABW1NWS0_9PSEU
MSHHHHGHTHEHHHEEVEGSRRDAEDDRPLSVARRRFLTGLGAAGVATTLGSLPAHAHDDRPPHPVNPWHGRSRWYAGDHHIHTR